MTLTELKKKIAESPNPEWYQNQHISISNQNINYSISLTGVVAIYSYLVKQIAGFEGKGLLPQKFRDQTARFISARDRLVIIVTRDNREGYEFNQIKNLINNEPPFPIEASETQFLLNIHNEFPTYYAGAVDFLLGQTQNVQNKAYFIGYIMAYEFLLKDKSDLLKRSKVEKKAYQTLSAELQERISNSETELTDYLSKANQKVVDKSSEIDDFVENKKDVYQQWFDQTSNDIAIYFVQTQEKVNELKGLYEEKLKLEAPAKYWNERAKKLRREGYWWLGGLIFCIALGVTVLAWVLGKIAAGTLTQIFSTTSTAIKWSIVLITLISFIAYAIRVISKLTFSSFHLVRDAEEREQLTYVYLALQKEKGVDVTERHLIMQSLFSRADSGLLKDDASPTMPGNIMDKIISK